MSKREAYALVTGSSRGIGRAIAEELAEQGYSVAVHGSKDSGNLQDSYQSIKKISPKSICLAADLSNPSTIERMFDEIQTKLGGLDVLINNAAVQNKSPFLEMNLEDWDKTMAVNLRAVFLCGQYAAKMMKQRCYGKIVNISSVHDTVPRRYYAHYSAAKSGLSMLTKCMALELADFNIQTNYLTVGGVATEMTDPEREKLVVSSIPANRIAQPREIGKLVAFLVSPDADYITGSGITIDGGLLLGFCATRREL